MLFFYEYQDNDHLPTHSGRQNVSFPGIPQPDSRKIVNDTNVIHRKVSIIKFCLNVIKYIVA